MINDNKNIKPIFYLDTNVAGFIYAFILVLLIPIQNYYQTAFIDLLIIIYAFGGAYLCILGIGQSRIKGFNKKLFLRVVFAWLGLLLAIPFSLYLDKLLNK